MRNTILFLLMLTMAACHNNPQKTTKTQKSEDPQAMRFFVGTYTDGGSEGIYCYELYPDGRIVSVGLAAKTDNPSFLTITADGQYLLAVNELDQNGSGFVSSFKIMGDSLAILTQQNSGGAHPCFVTVNKDGYVLVANYTGGNVGLLQLDQHGRLGNLLFVKQHFGKGTTDRQQSPHAHSAWFVPGSDEVVTADLGTNSLWFSKLDTVNKRLSAIEPEQLPMAEAAGPRHLSFHPGGQWMYVLNELNATVSVVKKDTEGKYVPADSYPVLPADFTGQNTAADIHISADGKFLYTSNRGHNSIAMFSIDQQNGGLNLLGFQDVHGNWPRNFTLSPDGKFLLVANRYSNNIVVFRRDTESGLLVYVAEAAAPSPVCLVF